MAGYKKVVPNETFKHKINLLKDILLKKLSSLKNSTSIKLLGSVPRETYIKTNKLDMDFFVYYLVFDFNMFLTELTQLFPNQVIIPKNRGFPYATIKLKGVSIDIVPCVIKHLNQKDKTELHHQYLSSVLTPELRTQIYKAKWIIRRIGLYDADASVKGFSGYTIECLIVKYGSLNSVPDELVEFRDPIDSKRNLFASISPENLQRFNILKHNNFRTIKRDPVKEIYVLPNASLNLHYTLKKHPNVVSCLYISNKLYLQLKDYYITPKKLMPYNSSYWKEKINQQVYYSVIRGLKKISPLRLIVQYGLIKSVNSTELRVYNYFR